MTAARVRVQHGGMCGRYARYQPLPVFAEAVGVPAPQAEGLDRPRYNVAPGTPGWLLHRDAQGEVVFAEMSWRFPTPRGNRINVRSETAHVVPEYREPFAQHRCVVLASGFYEPEGARTEKHRPWWYFEAGDHTPIFFGAIAHDAGFAILTRSPVDPVARVHDRSPVLVPADQVLQWLDPRWSGREVLAQAGTRVAEHLHGWRVSDAARNAAREGAECIARKDSWTTTPLLV
ncbi:MAG: SOS response-associated peptidase [Vulcanimicrobiaceae bacterium]